MALRGTHHENPRARHDLPLLRRDACAHPLPLWLVRDRGVLYEHGAGACGTYDYTALPRMSATSRWWKPLAGLPILVAGFFIMSLVVTLVALVCGVPVFRLMDEDAPITGLPDMAFLLASVAIVAPLPPLAYLVTRIPVRRLLSVTGRIRWRWLGECLLAALLIEALLFAISYVTDGGIVDANPMPLPRAWPLLLPLTYLVILPLQCAAEELVFRGWIMQAVGTWVKHPAVPILVQAPLFVSAHTYGLWGSLDIAAFALATGWLAYRTGGLESGFALHFVNNAHAFALSEFIYGNVDTNTEGTPLAFALSAAAVALYVALVEWRIRAHGPAQVAALERVEGETYLPVHVVRRTKPENAWLPASQVAPEPIGTIGPDHAAPLFH